MEYLTSYLYFLGVHTSIKASAYTEKIQVTSGYSMVYNKIALNNITKPWKIHWPAQSMRNKRGA